MTTTTKTPKAAPASKSANSDSITTYLPGDIKSLKAEAKKAGTTGTNLARILIRDGLAKMASGEIRMIQPSVPFTVREENGRIFTHGKIPAELYARACRVAEEKGISVKALLEYAITTGAKQLSA
jgi:hypothetical protein